MAHTETTFGPGSLEDLSLYTYFRTVGERDDDPRIAPSGYKLTGTYRVYCGMGNEHTVKVNIAAKARQLASVHGMPRQLVDPDSIAREMVEWSLEGWSDPCELPTGHPF